MSESTDSPILQIRDLSKSFRSYWTFRATPAVKKVSFSVNRGEAFGLLGHNGAGKTTIIKCLLGLIRKNRGQILLNGEELKHAGQRKILGYLPEQPYFYDHLRVRETLTFFASLHEIPNPERRKRIDQILELVQLSDRAKTPVRALSKGLQQRLGLAQAIINKPELLLLDEPFSGLDPIGRVQVREIIQQLRANGTTILMSSHILSDVEHICQRVIIIAKGEEKITFDLRKSAELFGERFELTLVSGQGNESLLEDLQKRSVNVERTMTSGGIQLIYTFHQRQNAETALSLAVQHKLAILSYRCFTPSLEEIFVSVTSNGVSAMPPPSSVLNGNHKSNIANQHSTLSSGELR